MIGKIGRRALVHHITLAIELADFPCHCVPAMQVSYTPFF